MSKQTKIVVVGLGEVGKGLFPNSALRSTMMYSEST